jgi:hypothetical protein
MDLVQPDGRLQSLAGMVDLGQLLSIRYNRGGIHLMSVENQVVRPRFSTFGQRIESTGLNGQLTTEMIADQLWEPGDYYVAVWGYNGAHSEQSYSLQVRLTPPVVPITLTRPFTLTAAISGGNSSVNTLILAPLTRISQKYTDTSSLSSIAALSSSLAELVTHSPEITEVIVDPMVYTDVQNAYAQWDVHPFEPKAANYVVEVLHQLLAKLLKNYPNTRYIILVGNDTILPFQRVPDLTLIANERYYNNPVWLDAESPSAARLRRSYLLSDNYYASYSPYTGAGLYIPEYAVGRLVETPAEMNAVVRSYLDFGPTASITTALVTGYDFLTDTATTIASTLDHAGVTVTTLVSNTWDAGDLSPLLLENWFSLFSLNGHFNHRQLLAADQTTTLASSQIVTASTFYTNALVYSTGCQSGLNMPDEAALLPYRLDFAQAFAGRGATYIGNTGYGYGDTLGEAYSEELAVRFTQMAAAGATTVGEALMRAKQAYIANAAYYSVNHALMGELEYPASKRRQICPRSMWWN